MSEVLVNSVPQAISYLTIKWSESDSEIYQLVFDGLTITDSILLTSDKSYSFGDFGRITLALPQDEPFGFFIEYSENIKYLSAIYSDGINLWYNLI